MQTNWHSNSNSNSRSSSNRRTTGDTSSLSHEELRMPSTLPNYSEKIAKKMAKTFQHHGHVVPFETFILSDLFYVYLFRKYKMDCNVQLIYIDIKDTDDHDTFYDDMIEENAERIFSCISRGLKTIIIQFNFNVFIDENVVGTHANLLIYRKNTSQIEHFEPHGSAYSGIGGEFVIEQINAFITQLVYVLNSIIKYENIGQPENKMQKITLTRAHDVCPDMRGLQVLEEASKLPRLSIEPSGYCMLWSMFFTELCLKNPERSSRDVYESIMEKVELYDDKETYLRNIMRGYTFFINSKITKHFSHIFDDPKFLRNVNRLADKLIADGRLSEEDEDKFSMYGDKKLEIVEVESGQHHPMKTANYPETRRRFIEFTQKIRSKTSSSPFKEEEEHISPPRTKKSTLKKWSKKLRNPL